MDRRQQRRLGLHTNGFDGHARPGWKCCRRPGSLSEHPHDPDDFHVQPTLSVLCVPQLRISRRCLLVAYACLLPAGNVTLASVSNVSAFSATVLSYSLASATGTTVVARMSNYIVSASATINITALLPSLAAAPASASILVANVTTALAFSLGVSPSQLTLGAINVAPMLTVAYNVSCGGTNSTYAAALVSKASGLGTSPTLTYALSLLSLPPASVTAAPTVFVVGTLQLSSLNATLIPPAVVTTTSALQQFYPGSTMLSLVSPPLNMQAVVQSALTSVRAACDCLQFVALTPPVLPSPSRRLSRRVPPPLNWRCSRRCS